MNLFPQIDPIAESICLVVTKVEGKFDRKK